MNILCTFPGKHGDCLWALPTVRAISETTGEPVDLMLAPAIAGLKPLIERQAYVGEVLICDQWTLQDTAPVTPRKPPCATKYEKSYERILHLGYPAWPRPDLPRDIYDRATMGVDFVIAPLDLDRPWITPPWPLPTSSLCCGFTDEHFELKYGLRWLMRQRFDQLGTPYGSIDLSTSPRWLQEGRLPGCSWETAAAWLASAKVFLGCCSALHVLACAVGTPVVLMEPNPHRHHEVFYPYGKLGRWRVQLVTGGDGQPTFDARHVGDAVAAILAREVPDGVRPV